jgi:hypothetical protein
MKKLALLVLLLFLSSGAQATSDMASAGDDDDDFTYENQSWPDWDSFPVHCGVIVIFCPDFWDWLANQPPNPPLREGDGESNGDIAIRLEKQLDEKIDSGYFDKYWESRK